MKKLLLIAITAMLISPAQAEIQEFTNEDVEVAEAFKSHVELVENKHFITCQHPTLGATITMPTPHFVTFVNNIQDGVKYRCHFGMTME